LALMDWGEEDVMGFIMNKDEASPTPAAS
jgi:hypothetical protein